MFSWDLLISSAIEALRWQSLLASFVGVVLGLCVGAMPGLTISLGMILMLPFTFYLKPVTAISLLLGLYAAGMTGGSISAILLNMPGTPSASATMLDGYPMTQRGEAGKAMGIAVIASFCGGMFSLVCLVLFAPLIAKVALQFGSPELFSLVLMGLTLICTFAQDSLVKGLISGTLGLIFMTVGLDPMMGTPRFTFGVVELQAGVLFLAAMIGLFALSQVLEEMQDIRRSTLPHFKAKLAGFLPRPAEIKRCAKAIFLGAGVGTGIGAIPGAGGPIAVFLAYDYVRRLSSEPERFGRGAPEGVAAPEAANNGVSGGALIPMLTLGIPGDPITAVLLGALLIQGLIPGPMLMAENPGFVYSLFVAFLVANLINLVVALSGIRFIVQVLRIPKTFLLPFITTLCILGSYAIRNSLFDSFVMIFFGVLGYLMRRSGFPVVPMLLAMVLGPTIEQHLRLSLIIARGDPSTFVTHPISAAFLVLALLSLTAPLWGRFRVTRRGR
ncbi:MAG: tripartite tricarboxylate transporter permease [Candidatus Methylomirabilales bacterium]